MPIDQGITARNWATLGVLAIVMFLGGTDMTKVAVALPAMASDIGLGPINTLWAADSYALAAGASLVPSAVLADRYGRKRIYLTGLGVALAAAALATMAESSEVLILTRAGQGLGSAMLIAATVAIIRITFRGSDHRAVAYGVWTASFSAGSALGPMLGGALVELGHWRWVFLVNLPVLGVCLILALIVLTESKNPDAPVLDAASTLLSAGAVGLLIAGLKMLPEQQIPFWTTIVVLAGGMAAAVSFVIRQLRMYRPFLDVRLFTQRNFAVAAVVVMVTNGVFTAVIFILTQRFQLVHGMSAVHAGITLMPLAISSALGGIVGPATQRRLGQNSTLVCGVALTSVGLLLLTTVGPAIQMITWLFIGVGAGVVMAIGANAIMNAAPEQRTADAGAVQESSFALGAGGGIATLGALSMYLDQTQGIPGPSGFYDQGATAALAIAAIAYTCFAIVAAVVLLGGRKEAEK
ncbi:MFS transporter, DHA2 family, multidrug resistance protein [Amycolatopsis marina]|uniref:MFS transporter, DHA2 family, multidrug resistance protein n=1 Tax=Amycolatopsis marina TaxID=490629 RepID=A0A1I0VRB0_9PSEU|nr:MFS transporter [Amycolatopsis marina]SFA78216.1 MFS transporter, DHA2 family, multidrug resistance protein [Amycolatopsis marina]